MAVAIVRSLTLAQVQAAIDAGSTSWNNNYAGTQVYVTDKDWHLACYLDRVAKPLSGVLKITNGDTLPNWLTPETLLIDTGSLTGDLSNETGTPVEIQAPTGYTPRYVYSAGTFASNIAVYDMDDNILTLFTSLVSSAIIPNDTSGNMTIPAAYYDTHKLKIAIDLGTDTAQFVIEYTKKYI